MLTFITTFFHVFEKHSVSIILSSQRESYYDIKFIEFNLLPLFITFFPHRPLQICNVCKIFTILITFLHLKYFSPAYFL